MKTLTLVLFFLSSVSFGSGLFGLGSNPNNNYVSATGKATTVSGANQNILTRNTTSGKTFFISYLEIEGFYTSVSSTGATIGTCSLEIPAGTSVATFSLQNPTNEAIDRIVIPMTVPLAAPTSAAVSCIPVGSTSTKWQSSIGGYEN